MAVGVGEWLWDCSHYDWGRGPIDLDAAAADGIWGVHHKVGEGDHFYVDVRFRDFYTRAKASRLAAYGGYFVNHPGDQAAQVAWWCQLLDDMAPGWRTDPRFRLMVMDAEKFAYMTRAPSPAECRTFCSSTQAASRRRPFGYAPGWLYGDSLDGYLDPWPLWQSAYGSNPVVHYPDAYPGDASSRWAPYSGQTPLLLQFGSRTTIGSQPGCDANRARISGDALLAATYPDGGDVDKTDKLTNGKTVEECLTAGYTAMLRTAWAANGVGDDWDDIAARARAAMLPDLGAIAADVAELKSRPVLAAAPIDPAALKAVLLDPDVLTAIAQAVLDAEHDRLAD